MWPCMLMSFRSAAEQLRSSAEEIQHGRALLKIFGCSAAKCLISSWFGNQIHVHLVQRGQVCEKRQQIYWGKTTSPQNKGPHWRISTDTYGCVDTRGFFMIVVRQTWKNNVFVRSPKLPFLMTSVHSIRSVRKFFGFSAATVLHSLSVCLCKLNLPLLMQAETDQHNNILVKWRFKTGSCL